MSPEICPRSWEVESAHDGRLDARAHAAHLAHLSGCRACQREQRALAGYLESLQGVASGVNEVELRRVRQRVLAQASRGIDEAPPARRWPLVAACAAGAAACVLALAVFARPQPSSNADGISVQPRPDAHWRLDIKSREERVVLSEGTLDFRVSHPPGARHLIVVVPDGEIEDVGTTFSVSVEGGRTAAIRVREGRVVFHRVGQPELVLIAGSAWTPPPVRPAEPPPGPVTSRPREAPAATVEPVQPPAAAVHPDPSTHAQRAHAEAEDRAYLRIIQALRRSELGRARAEAEAYLRMFPGAFRAAEISKLVKQLAEREGATP